MNKCIREQTKVWEEEGGGVMNYETFNQLSILSRGRGNERVIRQCFNIYYPSITTKESITV